MSARRRSRNLTAVPSARRDVHPGDSNPYPVFSGPHAIDPARLTREERLNEIAAILARGVLRALHAPLRK